MTKRELLKDLLEQAKKVELPIEEMKNLFIGMGNPESKILIVGKEASIDGYNAQSILEIVKNISQWERDINKHWSEVAYREWSEEKFSPLYPYRGQIKKRDSRIRNPKAKYNFGTSPTWLNYQKVRDTILGTFSDVINFHENCFITELNQIPSRYSNKQEKVTREKMIAIRQKTIFASEYIRSFPVVILACGDDYVKMLDIKINSLFGVEKYGQRREISWGNKGRKQGYDIYRNIHGSPPKIVVHTWQLSQYIKDEYIQMIGKDIADFCNENNIKLQL